VSVAKKRQKAVKPGSAEGRDPLPNPKHEILAEARAAGKTWEQAAEDAGYKYHPGNVTRWRTNDAIAERVGYLRRKIQANIDVTVSETVRAYAAQAQWDPADILEPPDPAMKGVTRFKPMNDWPEHIRKCVQSIKCKMDPDGFFVDMEVKFTDRQKALGAIAKFVGMFDEANKPVPKDKDGDADRTEHLSMADIAAMPEKELLRLAEKAVKEE
jgi:hypothetical protein